MKLAISALVSKSACFILAAKFSAVNLLNSWVVIHSLLWSWSSIFFSISATFMLYSAFLTKLLGSVVSLASMFLTNSLYTVFLTTFEDFSLHHLAYLNQLE